MWIRINHRLGHVPDPLKLPSTDIQMRISTRFEKNSYSCPVEIKLHKRPSETDHELLCSEQPSEIPSGLTWEVWRHICLRWVVWLPAQPVSAHRSAWGLQAQLHAQFASAHRLGLVRRFDLRCGFLPNFQLSEEEEDGWRESLTLSSPFRDGNPNRKPGG